VLVKPIKGLERVMTEIAFISGSIERVLVCRPRNQSRWVRGTFYSAVERNLWDNLMRESCDLMAIDMVTA